MKDLTYNQAYSKLEELVIEIESDAIQLDTLADKMKQANALIQLCEAKLRTIDKEVNDALNSGKK